MANRGRKGESSEISSSWALKSLQMVDCSHEIRRQLLFGRKVMTNLDSVLKSRDITLTIKVHIVKAMVFPVVTHGWELDHEEGRTRKNWCLQTVVLEKTPESPLDSKEIKPVNPKGNQPWICTGRTDAEAEAPVFWSSDVNRRLIGKSLMLGNIKGRRKRGHQRMRWLDSITDAMNMNLGKLWETVRTGGAGMGSQRVRHDWAIEQQQGGEICKKVYGREL